MTKGIIAITENSNNTYTLTVSLPTAFCEQFYPRDAMTVWGHFLGNAWGTLRGNSDGGASCREQSLTFKCVERCEEVVRRTVQEIEIAKGHLAQRKTYRLVLDLETGNRTVQYEDSRNGASNRPF